MYGIQLKQNGKLLTITVDLSNDAGPSKSGKTTMIASTEGNISAPLDRDIKIGLNIFRRMNGRDE